MEERAAFAALSLCYALWTLWLDLRVYYGWQRGGWLGKFTHWALLLDLVFLAVNALCAALAAPPAPLLAARRALLLWAATTTLHVDLSFLLLVLPLRLAGKEKADAGILNPVSAHKHIFNLAWIFGAAALQDEAPDTSSIAFGAAAPVLLSLAYLVFALRVADPARAPATLRALGIAMPEQPLNTALPKHELGNITCIPGEWIYRAFRRPLARLLFLLVPALLSPLAAWALKQVHAAMHGQPARRAALLVFVSLLSPAVYCLPRALATGGARVSQRAKTS
jgi:hypothetical protein